MMTKEKLDQLIADTNNQVKYVNHLKSEIRNGGDRVTQMLHNDNARKLQQMKRDVEKARSEYKSTKDASLRMVIATLSKLAGPTMDDDAVIEFLKGGESDVIDGIAWAKTATDEVAAHFQVDPKVAYRKLKDMAQRGLIHAAGNTHRKKLHGEGHMGIGWALWEVHWNEETGELQMHDVAPKTKTKAKAASMQDMADALAGAVGGTVKVVTPKDANIVVGSARLDMKRAKMRDPVDVRMDFDGKSNIYNMDYNRSMAAFRKNLGGSWTTARIDPTKDIEAQIKPIADAVHATIEDNNEYIVEFQKKMEEYRRQK